MARTNPDGSKAGAVTKGREKQGAFDWKGFVEISLTSEEKERIADSAWEPADYLSFLSRVVDDGYKVSIVSDSFNQCVVASLTGRASDCMNPGLTLSARGPETAGAIRALAYKHIEICEELRWDNRAETRGPDAWG
jgi:hypothetical protein